MITDEETNTVYFSDLIQSKPESKPDFERLKLVLDKHNVNYRFLKDTKDIWCRDFMPIQVDESKFVQFRYEPSYLKNYLNLQSDPEIVLRSNGIKASFSNINLEGGNVIKWSDKAILTKRVFKENPEIGENELIKKIETELEAEILFIPDIAEDMTGHADGHLRFIDEKTVLVNELENELKYWQTGFLKMVKDAKLDLIELPWFEHRNKNHSESAIGVYVNYLEMGNLILFPIFEIEGNKDDEAVEVIASVFPERTVETININEVGKYGGLLNCITWTIKQVEV